MVDTGTGLSLLAPSALMLKILGPTAEYLGDGVQQWTERRVRNVSNVFEKAGKKLGADALQEEGSVPPKILKGILEEASFCEDELAAEYLGGVLASSRSSQPRDDRAISLLSLVSRMSSYQLRTHYVMYSAAHRLLVGTNVEEIGKESFRRREGTFFLPDSLWGPAMEFSEEERERERFQPIVDHVLYGLVREGLIADKILGTGPPSFLNRHFKREFPEEGIIFCISMLGMELFVAAHGVHGRPAKCFVEEHAAFEIDNPLPEEGSLIPLTALPVLATEDP